MLSVDNGMPSADVGSDRRKSVKPVAIIYSNSGRRDGQFVSVDDSKPGNTTTPPVTVTESEHIAVEPTHDPEGRDVVMIGGKSGSGKSYAARNFAIRYHRLYPDRPVRLLSYLEEDKTIDACSFIERIDPEKYANSPPKLDNFEKSLTIFDDIEGFEKGNKAIHVALQQVIDMVATTGRHNASSLVVCSHLLTDYKRTRLFLGEAHMYIVFPHGCSLTQLTRLLGGYGGADKKDITKIRSLPTRWVALRTSFPPMVIHENGVYLLHQEDRTKVKGTTSTGVELPESEEEEAPRGRGGRRDEDIRERDRSRMRDQSRFYGRG